mmetsp:Transcript_23413/g.38511  ORF Transcript_23413/g.38511 Transcript_23413/m.38511 type:complete len:201 (-) Transcript_23413:2541-3143(-)
MLPALQHTCLATHAFHDHGGLSGTKTTYKLKSRGTPFVGKHSVDICSHLICNVDKGLVNSPQEFLLRQNLLQRIKPQQADLIVLIAEPCQLGQRVLHSTTHRDCLPDQRRIVRKIISIHRRIHHDPRRLGIAILHRQVVYVLLSLQFLNFGAKVAIKPSVVKTIGPHNDNLRLVFQDHVRDLLNVLLLFLVGAVTNPHTR